MPVHQHTGGAHANPQHAQQMIKLGSQTNLPPPWMSMTGPMRCRIMEEHSKCHPGRPLPHGLSHVGSPGFALFHSAKSAALRLPSSDSCPACSDASSCAGLSILRRCEVAWADRGGSVSRLYPSSQVILLAPVAMSKARVLQTGKWHYKSKCRTGSAARSCRGRGGCKMNMLLLLTIK